MDGLWFPIEEVLSPLGALIFFSAARLLFGRPASLFPPFVQFSCWNNHQPLVSSGFLGLMFSFPFPGTQATLDCDLTSPSCRLFPGFSLLRTACTSFVYCFSLPSHKPIATLFHTVDWTRTPPETSPPNQLLRFPGTRSGAVDGQRRSPNPLLAAACGDLLSGTNSFYSFSRSAGSVPRKFLECPELFSRRGLPEPLIPSKVSVGVPFFYF